MPKANALSNTPRRSLFSGVIAASILAGTGGIAQAGTNQDALLLHVCAEFNRAYATIKEIEGEPETKFGSPENMQWEQRLDYFSLRAEQLLDQISEMPARTYAGILAKADVIRKYLPQYIDEYEAAPESSQIRIVLSLMDDLLSKGKGAQI